MKQIVIFPRGHLQEQDKRRLERAGVCVVEADDPSKVVCALPSIPILESDDICLAALEALVSGVSITSARDAFQAALLRLLKARRAKGSPA